MYINGIENSTYGLSFWKFNASLSEDEEYVDLIRNKIGEWVDESREIEDPRVTWDYLKYKIRYETIGYSKKKAKERRSELVSLESRLKECQRKCDEHSSTENLCDYITQGAIIRSRVNWYEEGEKNSKYFLNLESAKKKKTCIRKLSVDNDSYVTEPKEIMKEIHDFYEKLYDII